MKLLKETNEDDLFSMAEFLHALDVTGYSYYYVTTKEYIKSREDVEYFVNEQDAWNYYNSVIEDNDFYLVSIYKVTLNPDTEELAYKFADDEEG